MALSTLAAIPAELRRDSFYDADKFFANLRAFSAKQADELVAIRPIRIVRVGVKSNFFQNNAMHPEEIENLLHVLKTDVGANHPTDPGDGFRYLNVPFVNTHAGVELTVPIPSFVTCNPNFHTFIAPHGPAVDMVRAVRLKFIPFANQAIKTAYKKAFAWAEAHKVPVLWTRGRIYDINVLNDFCECPAAEIEGMPECKLTRRPHRVYEKYKDDTFAEGGGKFVGSYWASPILPPVDFETVFCCDQRGYGCQGCQLCSLLSYGLALNPWSLDLTASMCYGGEVKSADGTMAKTDPRPNKWWSRGMPQTSLRSMVNLEGGPTNVTKRLMHEEGAKFCSMECTQCFAKEVLKQTRTKEGGESGGYEMPQLDSIYANYKQTNLAFRHQYGKSEDKVKKAMARPDDPVTKEDLERMSRSMLGKFCFDGECSEPKSECGFKYKDVDRDLVDKELPFFRGVGKDGAHLRLKGGCDRAKDTEALRELYAEDQGDFKSTEEDDE